MKPGSYGGAKVYCGRPIGTSGRCGPFTGNPCEDCQAWIQGEAEKREEEEQKKIAEARKEFGTRKWKVVWEHGIAIRDAPADSPDKASKLSKDVQSGTIVEVDEENFRYIRKTGEPITWLHLADGSGWIFNQWQYDPWCTPLTGTDGPAQWQIHYQGGIVVRVAPTANPGTAQKGGLTLAKGTVVEVDEERVEYTAKREPITWLRLANGNGWIFNQINYELVAFPVQHTKSRLIPGKSNWKVVWKNGIAPRKSPTADPANASKLFSKAVKLNTVVTATHQQLIVGPKSEPITWLYIKSLSGWIMNQWDWNVWAVPVQSAEKKSQPEEKDVQEEKAEEKDAQEAGEAESKDDSHLPNESEVQDESKEAITKWKILEDIGVREAPHESPEEATRVVDCVAKAKTILRVAEEKVLEAPDGEPITWLRLANGKGWIFNEKSYRVIAIPLAPKAQSGRAITH